jgi:NTE family protein
MLSDGGVYDNLGLETAWKNHRTVLVSDGGAMMKPQKKLWPDWISQFMRVREIQDNQVRALRKRQLHASYDLPPGVPGQRFGAFWSMLPNRENRTLPGVLKYADKKALSLAGETTRLGALSERRQKELVNWGFVACDAALRRAARDTHLAPEHGIETALQLPIALPYPDAPLT